MVCPYHPSPNWKNKRWNERFPADFIDPFMCTHLIYQDAAVSMNFRLEPNEIEGDIEHETYNKMNDLKKLNPKLKTLICFVSESLEQALKGKKMTKMIREVFIKSVITFLKEYNFDGLDIWVSYN